MKGGRQSEKTSIKLLPLMTRKQEGSEPVSNWRWIGNFVRYDGCLKGTRCVEFLVEGAKNQGRQK